MPDGNAAALPSWDLRDLYPAPDSPELVADLARAEAMAKAFASARPGTLAAASGADVAAAIGEYEAIEEIMGRARSYAQLLFAGNSADAEVGKFYQSISERTSEIGSNLIFFTLELNRLEDAELETKFADPALARYRPWLRDLRMFRNHQLDDIVEKLLHEKEVTGGSAWSRLFDETIAGMRIPLNGEEMTVSAALNRLSDADRSVREAAGRAIDQEFPRHIGPRTVWTTGRITLEPGAPSIIPGAAEVLFQFRDIEMEVLERLQAVLTRLVHESNRRERCTATLIQMSRAIPAICDREMMRCVEQAAEQHAPGLWQIMPSGAGHDAQYMARVMPAVMLFTPSIGGISHHWAEDTAEDDLALCCEILGDAAAGYLAAR